MHLGMAECHVPFPGHCELWPCLNNYCGWSIIISCIIWDRSPKIGVWMHLVMVERGVPFTGHCDLDLWVVFRIIMSGAYFGCWFLLIWRSGAYHFGSLWPWLTSGLISRFFVSGAYLLYYSLLSLDVSYARPIPLGAFVTLLWHFLFFYIVCVYIYSLYLYPRYLYRAVYESMSKFVKILVRFISYENHWCDHEFFFFTQYYWSYLIRLADKTEKYWCVIIFFIGLKPHFFAFLPVQRKKLNFQQELSKKLLFSQEF